MESRQNEALYRSITRFEEAQLVGIRSEMLARGHPPLVTLTENMRRNDMYDVKLIAQEEHRQGLLPLVLKRIDGKNSSRLEAWRDS